MWWTIMPSWLLSLLSGCISAGDAWQQDHVYGIASWMAAYLENVGKEGVRYVNRLHSRERGVMNYDKGIAFDDRLIYGQVISWTSFGCKRTF